jgi:hypothetical protein
VPAIAGTVLNASVAVKARMPADLLIAPVIGGPPPAGRSWT